MLNYLLTLLNKSKFRVNPVETGGVCMRVTSPGLTGDVFSWELEVTSGVHSPLCLFSNNAETCFWSRTSGTGILEDSCRGSSLFRVGFQDCLLTNLSWFFSQL